MDLSQKCQWENWVLFRKIESVDTNVKAFISKHQYPSLSRWEQPIWLVFYVVDKSAETGGDFKLYDGGMKETMRREDQKI